MSISDYIIQDCSDEGSPAMGVIPTLKRFKETVLKRQFIQQRKLAENVLTLRPSKIDMSLFLNQYQICRK